MMPGKPRCCQAVSHCPRGKKTNTPWQLLSSCHLMKDPIFQARVSRYLWVSACALFNSRRKAASVTTTIHPFSTVRGSTKSMSRVLPTLFRHHCPEDQSDPLTTDGENDYKFCPRDFAAWHSYTLGCEIVMVTVLPPVPSVRPKHLIMAGVSVGNDGRNEAIKDQMSNVWFLCKPTPRTVAVVTSSPQ